MKIAPQQKTVVWDGPWFSASERRIQKAVVKAAVSTRDNEMYKSWAAAVVGPSSTEGSKHGHILSSDMGTS